VSRYSALSDGQPEAEAGTLTSFAMDEWLEKCFQYLVRSAGSLVQDLDLVAITRLFQSDLHTAASGRETHRIAHHVFKGVSDKFTAATYDPFPALRRYFKNDLYASG
jgi:hypothetical protein